MHRAVAHGPVVSAAMAFYLFNYAIAPGDEAPTARERAVERLRSGAWDVDPGTPHRDALSPGDLALVYVAAPERVFIGRAELASAVQALTPADGGDLRSGVVLSDVEEWDPPVPMQTVLARIDRSANARADFDVDVVRITPQEYETALAVAAERRRGEPGDRA